MIHRIHATDASHKAAAGAAPKGGAAAKGGRSFAEVHAAALTEGTDPAPTGGTPAADKTAKTDQGDGKRTATKSARGEKLEPVKGHHYAHIASGPRNGMELNTSGNARDGEAFVIVRRDGRTFHVYDVAGEHQVYEVDRG